jgi:hypothetical protein
MPPTVEHSGTSEISILARVLGDEQGRLSLAMARHILTLGFGDHDKARMQDLAERNQEAALSSAEREELFAYAKAGTLLSILKSRARRTLKTRPKKRSVS